MEHQKTKEIIQDENLDFEQKTKEILRLHHEELNTLKESLGSEKEALQKELKEANGLLKKLEKESAENETAQQLIQEHQQTIETLKKELQDSKIDNAIEMALTKAGARNVGLTSKALDRDLISLDKDGMVIGLEEQIKKLQTSEDTSFLFKPAVEETPTQSEKKPIQPYAPTKGKAPEQTKTRGAILAERKKAEMQKSQELRDKVIKGVN